MTVLIDKRGARQDGSSMEDTIVRLVQFQTRQAAHNVGSLTDNTGVVADGHVNGVTAPVAATAVVGTNLADVVTSKTALTAVQKAIASVAAQADSVLTTLGIVPAGFFVDNSGAVVSTTLAAAPAGVTASATGPNAANVNAVFAELNNHLYVASNLVRQVALAAGVKATFSVGEALRVAAIPTASDTVAAYDPTAIGAAAAPGVAKADMDAAVARYMKDVEALAATLNACTAAPEPTVAVFGNRRSTPLNP